MCRPTLNLTTSTMQTTKPNIHTPVVPMACAEQRPSAWRVYVNGEKPEVFDELPKAITHATQNHGRIVPLAEVLV